MEKELFREKIVKEYVHNRKPEKKSDEVWSIDEYIKFYEDNKKSLNSLLLDINEYFVDNKKEIEKESNLISRQIGCIQRITKIFTNTLYGSQAQDFSQAYYELLDFIFYPGYDLKELSYNEIEIIRMMIAYLNNKADEFIKKYGLKGSSSINRAISALINKEYVYRYAEGYQVYDRFMQLWLVTLP